MPENWSVKGILEDWIGSPVTWLAGFGTIVGLLSWLGIDKKMGFDIGELFEKAKDFISGIWNKIIGTAESTIDPESVTMNKAIADRIDADKSFALAERATGIKGIGKELRDMAKEAAKNGGDPIKVGQQLREDMIERIVDKWQDANPKGKTEQISEQAAALATEITGVTDAAKQPRIIEHGIVGLMQQAQAAKKEEGTLTEGEVKAIQLSPELKALAEAAATPNAAPAPEGSAPATPPKTAPKVRLAMGS